jgi:hypothetical protein
VVATAVTPTGVRDGDPEALAGLCAARGDAVLSYCEKVAGNEAAATAAAEAFGRFRAAVVATADLTALNPEEVLVNATRHAAADHASVQAAGVCGEVPALLAARADRSISLGDLERLDSHLESCWACRAPVARFKAAERAYRDPPGEPVAPDVVGAIIAALAAAAPVRGQEPEPVGQSASNGAGGLPATEAMLALADSAEAGSEHATAEYRPRDGTSFDTTDQPRHELESGDVRSSRDGSRRTRQGVVASLLARLGLRSSGEQTLATTAPVTAPEPRLVAGTHLPRRQRGPDSALPGARATSAPRPTFLLPIALVAIAVTVALLVAGVFTAGEPASRPLGPAPAVDSKSTGAVPKIVVVPGAADASSAAVELAKRRARAKRRREATLASQPATPPAPAATTPAPAPAAGTAPPAAGVTPPAAPAPPPPPAAGNASKPAPAKGTGGSRVGTGGNGATGSDQLPSQDTSSVPELAPPDDTSLPPG